MDINDERIRQTVKNTRVLRSPKQSLATFGTTNVHYYLLTEPTYSEIEKSITETVIREGRVIAERPKIVTPYYLSRLEGFSTEARRYFELLAESHHADTPGLFYAYKNEPQGMNIVSADLLAVFDRLNADIDERGDPMASIIQGEDTLWDVSLLRFIYEITRGSLKNNLQQLDRRGLLDMDARGVPAETRLRIEQLFKQAIKGDREPRELKEELDRWGLFAEYEDRFFRLFR